VFFWNVQTNHKKTNEIKAVQ